MEYSDCYKYLGLLLNTKNNLDEHIKTTRGKAEAAYQTILSIAGNCNMKNIERRTNIEMATNKKWTDKNQQNYGHHKRNTKGTLKYTKGSPILRDCVAGSRDNQPRKQNNDGQRLANNNHRMKRLIGTSQEMSWRETTDAIISKASIEEKDMQGEKLTVKIQKHV